MPVSGASLIRQHDLSEALHLTELLDDWSTFSKAVSLLSIGLSVICLYALSIRDVKRSNRRSCVQKHQQKRFRKLPSQEGKQQIQRPCLTSFITSTKEYGSIIVALHIIIIIFIIKCLSLKIKSLKWKKPLFLSPGTVKEGIIRRLNPTMSFNAARLVCQQKPKRQNGQRSAPKRGKSRFFSQKEKWARRSLTWV